MVSAVGNPVLEACREMLMQRLKEAALPGERSDHQWIAERILGFAGQLGEGPDVTRIAELLITGFLMDYGMDPAPLPETDGERFSEPALRAVPSLLKAGCPAVSWQLIDKGVLEFHGKAWGGEARWIIRGSLLQHVLEEWHELGEHLVMRRLAGALLPFVSDPDTPSQVKILGVDRGTGRRWVEELRACFVYLGQEPLPHLMVG